jgi:hypothetical protein
MTDLNLNRSRTVDVVCYNTNTPSGDARPGSLSQLLSAIFGTKPQYGLDCSDKA